jgi:putative spermidine/putrescine transport system permease protein
MVKAVPPWLRVASTLLVALTVLFLLAPLVVVIGVSFSESEFIAFPPKGFSLRWYEGVLTSNTYLASALASLQIAVLVTITATLVGGAAAVALHRGKLPFSRTLATVFLSPLVLPTALPVALITIELLPWALCPAKYPIATALLPWLSNPAPAPMATDSSPCVC